MTVAGAGSAAAGAHDGPDGAPDNRAPDVHVVVVTYQSAGHLASCLASVPRGCPITVVDNASTDGSAGIAEGLGATVVRNPQNRGFGAAANQGARLVADSKFVLLLNPDAQLGQGSLTVLASTFDDAPRLGIVGPRLLSPSGADQRGWWPFPSPGRTWLEALGLHRLVDERVGPGRAVPFIVGACLLIRRQLFEDLHGFDEAFWLYGEEADLCRRARSLGWEVRYVPEASALHVGGASGTSNRSLTFEHFQRGTERFILKHHGPGALAAHRVGLLVGSLVRLVPLAVRRSPGARVRFDERRRTVARMAAALASHPTRMPR